MDGGDLGGYKDKKWSDLSKGWEVVVGNRRDLRTLFGLPEVTAKANERTRMRLTCLSLHASPHTLDQLRRLMDNAPPPGHHVNRVGSVPAKGLIGNPQTDRQTDSLG